MQCSICKKINDDKKIKNWEGEAIDKTLGHFKYRSIKSNDPSQIIRNNGNILVLTNCVIFDYEKKKWKCPLEQETSMSAT